MNVVTGLVTHRVSTAISGASGLATKAMRWRSWSPYLDSLHRLFAGRVVQVVHRRGPRATPRDHRAGGGGRGRCLWTHLGNPLG